MSSHLGEAEPQDEASPQREPARDLPLSGTTVLDLGQIYLGPYASFLMATSGARVIKVEPPEGEPLRGNSHSLPYALLNASKEAVTLNLKHDRGRELLLTLARQADVLTCNFAPGVTQRLGIDAPAMWQVNPALVYAQATGFGLDGPDANRTAMDLTVQAHMGPMSVTGYPDRPGVKAGVAFIDILGGTHLFAAVAAALVEVARTGVGRMVETSMAESAFFTLATYLQQWHTSDDGATPRVANKHATLGLSPYDTYECADGYVALIVISDRQWRAVADVIGRDDLADDERYARNRARIARATEVDALVTGWTSERPKAEVAAAFAAAGVPVAQVRDIDEVVHDQHLTERGFISWAQHPEMGRIPRAQSPIRWHGSELPPLRWHRPVGADNEAIFGELAGLSPDEVAALASEGVI